MTFFIPITPQTKSLAQYIIDVRRLLHDALGQYWTDVELTDYINAARDRVVADTGCNRMKQAGTLAQGTESYLFSAFSNQYRTFDVLNIRLLWGSAWYQLDYMPFGELSTRMRAWKTMQQRPVAFSVYGQNTIYVGPLPDQAYTVELDTVVAPAPLVVPTDQDFIAFPYVGCVAFYAAYLAKFKEGSMTDADRFKAEYAEKAREAIRSSFTRRIPSMYT